MLFTSLDFLVFLAFVLPAHWLLFSARRTTQNLCLLLASYVFYGYWDARFLLLMMVSSVADFWFAQKMAGAESRSRRAWLAASLTSNLGGLFFFKYFAFAASWLPWSGPWSTWKILLPVGISFYTFQAISYTIDVYRGREPAKRLLDFLLYVAFFPHLVAGPIQRADELLVQLETKRTLSPERLSIAVRFLLWGYFKKLVVGDNCGVLVDAVFADPEASGASLWLGLLLFSFQIYADFSGYSDIAVGLAHLFGIRLGANFRSPYLARGPREFWQRWHISLSTWFRDYLYIPLGGNREHQGRNIMLTFLASGLWHGANWTFLAWGAGHGLAYLLWPGWRRGPLWDWLERLLSFIVVTWLWVLFRAPSLSLAGDYTRRAWSPEAIWPAAWDGEILLCATVGITLTLAMEWWTRREAHPCERWKELPTLVRHSLYGTLLVALYLLGNFQAGYDFIYFQF